MKNEFPFKTLIWAIIVVVALILFKGTLDKVLLKTQKLSILGVNVEIGQDEYDTLEKAVGIFEDQIDMLNGQISDQQERISLIDSLNSELQKEIQDCSGASETSIKINDQIRKVNKSSDSIKVRSNDLKNYEVLRKSMLPLK